MITFVNTRHYYQSYTDFWALVSLSQYPVCYVDEMDWSNRDAVYVITPHNGELDEFASKQPKGSRLATTILWNLERPAENITQYMTDNKKLIHDGIIDIVWVSDMSLSQFCGFEYITLGGHPGLGVAGEFDGKQYDMIALAYASPRRQWMFSDPGKGIIKNVIWGKSMAPNGWGLERHVNLCKSRVLLNTHQDDYLFCEPLRLTLAACYGLPIISEQLANPYPYLQGLYHVDGLERYIKTLLTQSNYPYLYDTGLQLRSLMTECITFRKCVESKV